MGVKKKIILTTILFFGALIVCHPIDVNAAWGPGSGSGGSSGCMAEGWWLSTCYGAGWRKYSVDDAPPGVDNSDKNNIYIAGESGISNEAYIQGCKNAGYYYRYAMIAHNYHDYGWWQVNVGDQVGVSAMNGDGNYWFLAEPFGGGMGYISWDVEGRQYLGWDDVEEAYNRAVAAGQVQGGLWNGDSNLGWFCAENPVNTKYASRSAVYYKEGNDSWSSPSSSPWDNRSAKVTSAETGVDGQPTANNSAPVITIDGNESIKLRFRHWLNRTDEQSVTSQASYYINYTIDDVAPQGGESGWKSSEFSTDMRDKGSYDVKSNYTLAFHDTSNTTAGGTNIFREVTVNPSDIPVNTTKTYCSYIMHDQVIKMYSNGTRAGQNGVYRASRACVKIYRPVEKVTFKSHSTAKVIRPESQDDDSDDDNDDDDDTFVVKSGWDEFNHEVYKTTKEQTKIRFTHKLKRTDKVRRITSIAGYWKLVSTELGNSVSPQQSDINKYFSYTKRQLGAVGNKTAIPTSDINKIYYTVNVKPGEHKTVCQAVYHEASITPAASGNSGRASSIKDNVTRPLGASRVCITVVNYSGVTNAVSTADTGDGYVGEQGASATFSANDNYHKNVYFYVKNGITLPTTNFYFNVSNQIFNRTATDANPPKLENATATAATNALCSHYTKAIESATGKRNVLLGSCPVGTSTNNNIVVPDNDDYIGAKICAASVSVSSRFSDWGSSTGTINNRPVPTSDYATVNDQYIIQYPIYRHYYSFSRLDCSPIYKKPTTQTRNGLVYASGDITGTTSTRKDSGQTATYNKTFGSWAEYLVISTSGSIKNFGSGASLRGNDLAKLNALSIANSTSSIGKSGINIPSTFSSINNLKAQIKQYDGIFNIIDKGDGTYNLTATQANNLNNSGKLNIVFAKNINIGHAVTNVNAWLIASDTINTCSGYKIDATSGSGNNQVTGINTGNCANQLNINGVVYANEFKLYRTFGAKSGDSAKDPAEIFNLAADNYRKPYEAAQQNSSQPKEVYTQELAPRQ